ncbi:aldo/keto reductase [Streptomyces sp. NPDC006476]|uniref:aldo/keto reductase n=1 Tax=Streptomyces sp. NPDC006476 TaxID=3157175 RepID=UPI0033B11138
MELETKELDRKTPAARKPKLNRLGKSRVAVTELSFGGVGIGNFYGRVSNVAARAVIETAWQHGIRYFDTAPQYGLGLSERRLGTVLRDHPRDTYTVSTQVGCRLEPTVEGGNDLTNGFAVPATHRRVWDFSAYGVRRSLEESLRRLGLTRVDIVYFHAPVLHVEQAFREGYPELERMRGEGLVRAIGTRINQFDLSTSLLRDTDMDVIQCVGRYNLLDQRALVQLLPAAQELGISVVIGGPFCSGLLADPKPGSRYAQAPSGLSRSALALKAAAARHGTSVSAAALAFCSAHPAVASVLIGARSYEQIIDVVHQFSAKVPADFWQYLKRSHLILDSAPVPQETTS